MEKFEREVTSRWTPLNGGRGNELLIALESFAIVIRQGQRASSSLPSKESARKQMSGYFSLAYSIYVGKFLEFSQVAIHCINREHYVMLASCLRNTLEHAGMLHYFLALPEISKLRDQVEQGAFTAEVYDPALKAIDRFVRGNAFAWDAFVEGDRQELAGKARASSDTEWQVPAARVALPVLYKDVPVASTLYNLLCDMVHPNMGGHMLLFQASEATDQAEIGGNGPKTPAFDLATRLMALMMPLYPVILSDLKQLQHLARETLNS